MNYSNLALLGGKKTINRPLKKYNSLGSEEVDAAKEVIESAVLSKFIASSGDDFLGGPKVKEFERACEKYFNVKHAISVNSWTSGLIVAVGAIGIEPGDEVIVTPWTMCATATAILHWNAIPVFADIEPLTFNIDPKSIIKNISPYTKAIMAVDIFGHSCNMDLIMEIANDHNLKVITDSAQSPGVYNKNYITGTQADVGGFSLNYHKHIHTGEGGILVTNDDELCLKMQLIRNHAEACVSGFNLKDISNMIGYNFRLGEIEAAIGIEQLKKLDFLVSTRQKAADKLSNALKNLKGLILPKVVEGNTHAYYVYPLILDVDLLNVKRERILDALKAEGLDGISNGYCNIHLLPIFQKKIAYGSKGFPWNASFCKREISYDKGICPVAEELNDKTFISFEMCLYELNDDDINLIIDAFNKVWDNMDALKSI